VEGDDASLQVSLQVGEVFEADRYPDESLTDAGSLALGLLDARVGRRRRMRDRTESRTDGEVKTVPPAL
jgi:hypothetical protein